MTEKRRSYRRPPGKSTGGGGEVPDQGLQIGLLDHGDGLLDRKPAARTLGRLLPIGQFLIDAREGLFQMRFAERTMTRLHRSPVRSVAVGAGTAARRTA